MRKNVLVAGIGQANYIFQLYGVLAPRLPNYIFNSLNLKQFGDEKFITKANKIFDHNYFYSFEFKNILATISGALYVSHKSYFWKDQRVLFGEKGFSFSESYRLVLRHIDSYYQAKFIDKNTDTDIIHLHVPRHRYALFLKYLKKDYQIIITYWGSDIFRINSWLDHQIQSSILKVACSITIPTPEMEFAVLTRYGFNFAEKMRRARFIHDKKYYEMANEMNNKEEWKENFRRFLRVDSEKTIILFGHNAHKENNHIKFLNVLRSLPEENASKFHIIFPLTYGNNDPTYIPKLREISKEIPIPIDFITEFMELEDLVKLKLISDVYIHCPTTDGLSAFLTEFFYTNNLAIVGAWLPYNTFRNFGIYYSTFENFNELQTILLDLDNQLHNSLAARKKNRAIVDRNFDENRIVNEWVEVFKELESSGPSEK